MSSTFKAGAVQAEPVWMDAAATADKTVALMKEAADAGAQLVAFPEMWIPGYPGFMLTHTQAETLPFIIRYRQQSIAADGDEVDRIRRAAREHNIAVAAFGYSERAGGTTYMSQMLIDNDGPVTTQVVGPSAIEAFEMESQHNPDQSLGGGYARIYGPDMQLKSESLPPNEEGIVYAEIDLSILKAAKKVLDPTGHHARPDVFSVSIIRRLQSAVTGLSDVGDDREPGARPLDGSEGDGEPQ